MSSVNTAILFPGQGSQAPGMGRRLAESSPEFMELWKMAERASGLSLREIYWESNDVTLMAETQNLQPAITVVNLALWLSVKDRLKPVCAAGHSLGEFSALAAAGVLDIGHILELVSVRGRLMAEVDPEHIGVMCAVIRLSQETVETAAREVSERTGKLVRIANKNTPLQFVLSGHRDAVEETAERLKSDNPRVKIFPLAVSGAFHTSMMAEASAEFAKLLDTQDWRAAAFPIYFNVSGEPLTEAAAIHAAVRRQMTSSVCWVDTITRQWKNGVRRWVEFGPQGVLTRMVRPILVASNVEDGSYATVHIPNIDAVQAFEG
ncbi:ACP S-malonyltransferase [uncultured Mailhella sp.]|uniref:ACP S-malonyltransferase n=1 Tax=uncultured Mailhella sp. TaxID=1981031 RepID=UPI0026318E02|nr:ACP S-malonyltransferase [uncultured Mailhella sp.]